MNIILTIKSVYKLDNLRKEKRTLMAAVTASATKPGLDCQVPKPTEGILAPVFSSKCKISFSAIASFVTWALTVIFLFFCQRVWSAAFIDERGWKQKKTVAVHSVSLTSDANIVPRGCYRGPSFPSKAFYVDAEHVSYDVIQRCFVFFSLTVVTLARNKKKNGGYYP